LLALSKIILNGATTDDETLLNGPAHHDSSLTAQSSRTIFFTGRGNQILLLDMTKSLLKARTWTLILRLWTLNTSGLDADGHETPMDETHSIDINRDDVLIPLIG
jgi:hypothetical protein